MSSVIQSVTAVNGDKLEWERVGRHRGSGLSLKVYPFRQFAPGRNFWASVGTIHDGYYSPRHHHNFDQIRFMLEGSTNLSGWTLGEGEVGYFPESVDYGPQEQKGDALILTVQFSGASGNYFLTPEELQATVAGLREKDPTFGEGGVGKDADGKQRDAYDIVWQTFTGKPIEFASPRLRDVVVMKPQSHGWIPQADGSTRVKPLGRFTEAQLEVAMVGADGALKLGLAPGEQTELWFLTKGVVSIDGESYPARSAVLLTAPAAPVEARAEKDTEFLVIRLPRAAAN